MADAHPITRQLSLQQLLLASKGLDQGFPPVVPHALGSLLSRDPSPDCTLTFENGDAPLRLHSLMLQLASPVIHDAVLCAKNCKDSSHGISLGVTGSRAAWIQMAARCYPLMHAPVKDTLVIFRLRLHHLCARIEVYHHADLVGLRIRQVFEYHIVTIDIL